VSSVSSSQQVSAVAEVSLASRIRTIIAQCLHVDVDSITNESRFCDDLGLDLFDVVELTMLLEQQLTNGRTTDDEGNIECVGDLVFQIEATLRSDRA
jgi:acyl carrier protein